MRIELMCNSCAQRFSVWVKGEQDKNLINSITKEDGLITCPRLCGGQVTSMDVRAPGMKDAMSLTAQELFTAVQGAGLRDELEKNPYVIEALLKAGIKSVDIETHQDKIYIHEIKVNGSTIHLTAGIKGAMVLKVTKDK